MDLMFLYEQHVTIGKCDIGLTGNGIKGAACGVTFDLYGDSGAPKTAEEGDDWWLSTWEEVIDNVDGKDEPLRNLGIIGESYQLHEVTDIKWVEWDVHGKPINTGHEVGVWGQGDVYSHMSASYDLICGEDLGDQLEFVPYGMMMLFHGMTTVGKPLVMKVGWQYDMTCNSLPIDTGSYVIVGQIAVVSKGVCCPYMLGLYRF